MNEILLKQITEDFSCLEEDVLDDKNHFTVYKVNEGRRKYPHIEECKLRAILINGKLIFTGAKEIISALKSEFQDVEGQWFLEPDILDVLEEKLKEFGQKISMIHPYYISENKRAVEIDGLVITKYSQEEIGRFSDDERFEEAFDGTEQTPDVIGISASLDGKIVGMAGASIDSPYMMQIGINVDEKYKGRNIGTTLVSLMRNEILDMGYLPYYGTSFSHIASQKVAQKAGFSLSWIELFTMPIEEQFV